MSVKRDSFASSFGVLVALAGSAIGLGNLWRFPYLVGTNGGAAFIIIYLAFVFLLCLPILISEFVVGRKSQANVFRAFRIIEPGRNWSFIGIFAVLAAVSILAFYSVVGGWTVDYLVRAVSLRLNVTGDSATSVFRGMVASPWEPIVCMALFLLLTGCIIIGGIQNGIEKFSKVMMPVLFFMIILIAVRSVTLPGSMAGIKFLFRPDFSKITGNTVLEALGQAFFSLSLGCGTIVTYASYVRKDERIVRTTALTAVSDTLFALIAGLAIMPAVFAFGKSPAEGPGLVFIIIPEIFSQIPAGAVLLMVFFFILLIAALTSSISLLEVVVTFLKEELRIGRKTAIAVSLALCCLLGSLSSLSQGALAGVRIFGLDFFDLFDFLSANILMPIGGLLLVVFVGWVMKKPSVVGEMTNGGSLRVRKWLYTSIYAVIRYVAPAVILAIMVFGFLA